MVCVVDSSPHSHLASDRFYTYTTYHLVATFPGRDARWIRGAQKLKAWRPPWRPCWPQGGLSVAGLDFMLSPVHSEQRGRPRSSPLAFGPLPISQILKEFVIGRCKDKGREKSVGLTLLLPHLRLQLIRTNCLRRSQQLKVRVSHSRDVGRRLSPTPLPSPLPRNRPSQRLIESDSCSGCS